jgi:hypothetical protein
VVLTGLAAAAPTDRAETAVVTAQIAVRTTVAALASGSSAATGLKTTKSALDSPVAFAR